MVSGSSGGIGLAFGRLVKDAYSDWEIVGLARRPGLHDRAFDASWPERTIREAVAGVGLLDALVCLHGADIVSPPLRRQPYETRLDALYQVDIAGTVKLVRATMPLLRPGAAIILMGSDESDTGAAGSTGELYALAKAAVTAYGKSLARSLGDSYRVIIVAPGWVLTRWGETLDSERRERLAQRTRIGRWQTPDEVAHTIVELLGQPGARSTGEVVYVAHDRRGEPSEFGG